MSPKRDQRPPTMMENVATFNSSIRTLLMVCVTGVVGVLGWTGYENYILPGIEGTQAKEQLAAANEQLSKLQAEFAQKDELLKEMTIQNDKLNVSMGLLKVDRRIAQLTVDKKGVDKDGNDFLEVTFSEVDRDGNVIGASREFTLPGSEFHIDAWVAQFDDKYVEQADPLRGASIFTFKRIYGDKQAPADGFPLDDFSKPEGIYADSGASEFAQQIWNDFGQVCNDRTLQEKLGIRAVYGQANYTFLPKEGQTYQVTIRASGAMSLVPLKDAKSLKDDEDSDADSGSDDPS